ncbi:MAG: hypothetical protein E5Y14_27205, partial [Mesorhizobium sp.]
MAERSARIGRLAACCVFFERGIHAVPWSALRCRTFDRRGTAPPSVLPDISPTRGEIGSVTVGAL